MYRAITLFTDLQDNGYKYMPGDTYPRHGLEPSKDRIEELLTNKNRRNKPMIEKVEEQILADDVNEPIDAETVETEPVEQPKPKRNRKKKAPEGE